MPNISDNSTIEGTLDHKTHRYQAVVQATAAATETVTVSSASFWIFTGTTAGQIFKLGDATTYSVGHFYHIHNNSSQTITLQNNAGTTLTTILAGTRIRIALQVNSTAAGTWSLDASGGTSGNGTEKTIYYGKGANVSNRYIPSAAGSGQNSDVATDGFPRPIKIIGYFLDYDSSGANLGKTFSLRLEEKLAPGTARYTISKPANVQTVYSWDTNGFATFAAGERLSVFAAAGTGAAFVPKLTLWYIWND